MGHGFLLRLLVHGFVQVAAARTTVLADPAANAESVVRLAACHDDGVAVAVSRS